MPPRDLTRRTVLVGGVASAVVAGTGVVMWLRNGGDASPSHDSEEPLPTSDEARPEHDPGEPLANADQLLPLVLPVGTAYGQLAPEEYDVSTLGDLVPALAGMGAADALSSLSALEGEIEADFAAGRTVDVAGWVLSETEARAAALISLSD